jgi:hypothetical protein
MNGDGRQRRITFNADMSMHPKVKILKPKDIAVLRLSAYFAA